MLWRLFLPMPNLQAGEPDIMFSCGRTSSTKLFSSLWLTHLDSMVFDYILSATLLPSHCGFFFMSLDVSYLFW